MLNLSKYILAVSTSLLAVASLAGDINQPKHLSNESMNKINQVRLYGLVAGGAYKDKIEDELKDSDFDNFGQSGCDVSIGNSRQPNSLSFGERDVIITGDVINYCK